jgi:hypothetical protein
MTSYRTDTAKGANTSRNAQAFARAKQFGRARIRLLKNRSSHLLNRIAAQWV